MGDIAVRADGLTKEYKLYESEMDRLKEAFNPFKKSYHRPFYALKNVSFQIEKGEKVGIIGSNGAGKSTLLKILTEVINPTEGGIEVNGTVAALLELGAGFNPDYTGLENIRFNAALMEIPAEELQEMTQKIIDFADIGEFIDQPVKNYSSGMFVRLAFATQIFSEPDILIVDEALSVGDIRFQQKCYRAMDQLMKEKTVLLVTHDTAAVTRFCDRVIWLNHGEVVFDGGTAEGLQKYQEFIINQSIKDSQKTSGYTDEKQSIAVSEDSGLNVPILPRGLDKKGTGDAELIRGGIFNSDGECVDVLIPGKEVSVVFVAEFKKLIERPIIGIEIFDRLGNILFNINSEMIGIQLPKGEGTMRYEIHFKMPALNHGEYTVTPGLASGYQDDHVQLCWIDDALCFRIERHQYDVPGFFYLEDGEIKVSRVEDRI